MPLPQPPPRPTGAGEPPNPDMVWIPGGTFRHGPDRPAGGAAAVRCVIVDPFWMDRAPVTNAQFRRFVEAIGHVTLAERVPDASSSRRRRAGSFVLVSPAGRVHPGGARPKWRFVAGADWRHPEGPRSDLEGRDDHPVVHVALADAEAYARWAAKELPTAAERALAVRGGLEGPGEPRRSGFAGTSPVGTLPPNVFGLFDLAGNVREWLSDGTVPARGAPDTVAAASDLGFRCVVRPPRSEVAEAPAGEVVLRGA